MKKMNNYQQTDFVRLDPHKCKACWKCVDNCPEIIGKVNMLSHKHARIDYPDRCIGCLQCVRLCPASAFTLIQKAGR